MVHRYITVLLAVLLIGWSVANVYLLGSEFLPTIDEGNLLVRATMPASISLSRATEISTLIEKSLMEFPEVETVVAKSEINTLIPALKERGATDIIELPIAKIVH